MIRLAKTKPTQWQGNGMGTSTAEWTLASDRAWTIWSLYGTWRATHPDGHHLRADSRAALIRKLGDLLK